MTINYFFILKIVFELLSDNSESINKMLARKADEKNIILLFTCDKDVPELLLGDKSRLAQIIINLTINAINFTEKGIINVRAKVLENENKNTLLEFSVTDTGIGISLDKIKTIFDRFRQIESHDKRKQGGLGLGLSIAKRLVDLQGGTMTVESELMKGSVFSFCIPYNNYTYDMQTEAKAYNSLGAGEGPN